MNRKPFQSVQTIIICQECGKEHFNYSAASAGCMFSLVKYYKDSSYSPPPDGYSQEVLDLSKCLDHTKGRETIHHSDRNIILLKKRKKNNG